MTDQQAKKVVLGNWRHRSGYVMGRAYEALLQLVFDSRDTMDRMLDTMVEEHVIESWKWSEVHDGGVLRIVLFNRAEAIDIRFSVA